jgi:hypothetical protein
MARTGLANLQGLQVYLSSLYYLCSYTIPACICYGTSTLAAASFLLAWSQLKDILPEIPQDWTRSFEEIDWKNTEQVQEVDKVMQNALDLWKSAKGSKIKEAGAQLENVSLHMASRYDRRLRHEAKADPVPSSII